MDWENTESGWLLALVGAGAAIIWLLFYSPTARTVARYVWFVAVWALNIIVVLLVLSRTHEMDKKLTVVIATLGLIYTAMRGYAILQGQSLTTMLAGLAEEIVDLREKITLSHAAAMAEEEDLIEQAARKEKRGQLSQLQRILFTNQIKGGISGIFLTAISLICLYWLYVSLF